MGIMGIIFWFVFSCLLHSGAPCWGGGGGGYYPPATTVPPINETTTNSTDTNETTTQGKYKGYNGTGGKVEAQLEDTIMPEAPPIYIKGEGGINPDFWEPPPGMTKEDIMKNMMDERNRIRILESEMQAKLDEEQAALEAKMRDPKYKHLFDQLSSSEREELIRKLRRPKDADEDWPAGWTDLGYTYTGNAPPEHARVPQGAGKAGMCFMPPIIGKCKDYEFRYGYNPYTAVCEKFVYSGCDGNANNFFTLKRCQEVCEGPTLLPNCESFNISAFSPYNN